MLQYLLPRQPGILLLLSVTVLLLKPLLAPYRELFLSAIHERFSPAVVLVFFYASESVLGLIPPDLFMLWAAIPSSHHQSSVNSRSPSCTI